MSILDDSHVREDEDGDEGHGPHDKTFDEIRLHGSEEDR